MSRIFTGWLLAAALVVILTPAVEAQTRRALVIGIDDYREVPKLEKAIGDARALRTALGKLGFEVDILENPDRRAFNAGVSAFAGKLKPGDIALLHFSGHGVALDGENYLLPADAPRVDRVNKEELKGESFALMSLIERIRESGSAAQIVIVDACRDNPYAKSQTRSVAGSRGLIEPARRSVRGQGGFFILFSAGFGQTAADRLNDNDREPTSVYTRTLLRKIAVEGKAITDLAREVREDVEDLAATVRHEQRPAYYDELSGPAFFFSPPRAGTKDPASARDLELAFWNSIKDASSPALLREYLDRFGAGATFASIARERLRDIEAKQQTPPAAAQPPSPPVQVAALSFQPSFDCRADTKPVEQAICGDAGLASRDRILAETYYRIADRAAQAERAALRDAQRDWIRQRNACGPNIACIAQSYDRRIAQLQGGTPQVAAVAPPPQRSTAQPVPPSFACTGALTPVERMICTDPALAERDNELDRLYRQARAVRPAVLEGQRAWIRLRNACTDAVCVARAYDARIGQLRAALR